MGEKPDISVVIAVVSDTDHLRGCLNALQKQEQAPSMEWIVPHDGTDPQMRELETEFPEARFPEFHDLRHRATAHGGSREHHDELRARGLACASGRIIALLEDHGRVDAHWARRIMDVHQSSYAAVGGAIDNEVDRALNWAVYFCDFGRYQNPVREGPSYYLSDANVSYKHEVLDRIKDLWMESFHETSVHGTLLSQGETLWLSPRILVYQHRENLGLGQALRERYVWGRSFAGTRSQEVPTARRLFFLLLSPLLPMVLVIRKIRDILRKKRLLAAFAQALPLIVLLTFMWSIGEFVGYLTGRPASGE